MEQLITQRLVEMTFAAPAVVAAWLTRFGLAVEQKEGVLHIHNPYLTLSTAFEAASDPITRAVCLGFALGGASWPAIFPQLLTQVGRAWRAGRQPAPAEKAPRLPNPPPAPTGPTFADLYKQPKPGS